jgi:hypothetical protein
MAGVATSTADDGAWKRLSQAYVSASGRPKRGFTYSGKQVWYAVVKARRCLMQ